MPADFRPTHRATIWFANANLPYLLDLQVDGKFLYPPNSGRPMFHARFKPGVWHYIGGETLKRFERFDIAGLPGRRPSAGSRSQELPLRIDGRDFTLRVTPGEWEAFRAVGQPSAWFAGLLAGCPKPAGVSLAAHLRAIGRKALGMPEE